MKNQVTRILWFFLVVLTFLTIDLGAVYAQVREILLNHKIPDVEINDILNYQTPTAKLSDFKGKLVILDFWATYCSPCIAMFPKTDSLEKQFEGKVKFLAITSEPKVKVNDFLKRLYVLKHLRPVSIFEDTLFKQYFPYSSIPYYVWINAEGRVVATTTYNEITAENIQAVLAGQPTTFENETDVRYRKLNIQNSAFLISNNFALRDTSLKRDTIPRDQVFGYSIATRSIKNVKGHLRFDPAHFAVVNYSIAWLYRGAYELGYYDVPVQGAFTPNRTCSYEITDTAVLNKIDIIDNRLKPGTAAERKWGEENTVCYELFYQKGMSWKEKMKTLREDLDRYFAKPMGFRVHVEQRLDTNVNVLRRTDSTITLSTNGGEQDEHHDRYQYVQRNLPLGHLVGLLNGYYYQDSKTSFVDKTGIETMKGIDITLTCDMNNLQAINQQLARYGLKFTKESMTKDVLVFSDDK